MQKLFENWRRYQKETLEEAAQIPRIAQAARPYLNKIGRFLNKAPKWWRSGPSTGGDINIKYGPILNKIMGSNASRMITYLHPNEWWARTIMQVAAKLGPLHSPAFKFMYGTLMTWNAVRAPAVVATGGNWLVNYLTDPKTQEEFDSPNAALAEHLKLMLEEGASEEELIIYLEEVEKVKNLIQPEPEPEPEPMIEPYEKVMP